MAKKRGRPPYDPYYNPSYETRFKPGLRHPRARPVVTPYGTYPSLREAARDLGKSVATVWYDIQTWEGWYYL